jgi:hypothetical protein
MLEEYVAKDVQELLQGDLEIDCLYGCIDLLTKTQVVEIKNSINWKQGLGQVLIYSLSYPEKEKILVLFNHNRKTKKEVIQAACAFYEVKIIWW